MSPWKAVIWTCSRSATLQPGVQVLQPGKALSSWPAAVWNVVVPCWIVQLVGNLGHKRYSASCFPCANPRYLYPLSPQQQPQAVFHPCPIRRQMMVTEVKSKLVSAFARRGWLCSEGDHSPKPSGTHSRYFHRVPPPRFWELLSFLLAPTGWQWEQRLSLLCGAFVAAVAWRVMQGTWEVVFSVGASTWLLSHLYVVPWALMHGWFILLTASKVALGPSHGLSLCLIRSGQWSRWPSSVGQPC